MFETSGIINKESFRELAVVFVPRWFRIMCPIVGAALALSSIFMSLFVSRVMGIVYVLLGLICFIGPAYQRRKVYKKQVRRMAYTCGEGGYEYLTRLDEESVHAENKTTNNIGDVPYEEIKSVQKMKNHIILFTASKQAIFIFRDQLTDYQEQELFAFLQRKSVKV